MTLPPEDVSQLGLAYVGIQPSLLADGTRVLLKIYRLAIIWHDMEQEIEILEMNGAPLLGMSLLEGNEINIQAVEVVSSPSNRFSH